MTALVQILAILIVFYLLWRLLSVLAPPPPFLRVLQAILILVAAVWIMQIAGLFGGPRIHIGELARPAIRPG